MGHLSERQVIVQLEVNVDGGLLVVTVGSRPPKGPLSVCWALKSGRTRQAGTEQCSTYIPGARGMRVVVGSGVDAEWSAAAAGWAHGVGGRSEGVGMGRTRRPGRLNYRTCRTDRPNCFLLALLMATVHK